MWQYNYTNYNYDELYHYGVQGMRWGHRNSIKAAIAKRKNDKIDKSFIKWKENVNKRDNAIDLGKELNKTKIAYENNRSSDELKKQYHEANKNFKKAYRQNTTFYKGAIRQQVGQDLSRKYLSESKKVKKQLSNDPTNKDLQKKYGDLLNKHDIERAKARKAISVGEKRMRAKSSVKRAMTIAVTSVATSAAIAGGVYAANKYFTKHNTTLNGKPIRINSEQIRKASELGKKIFSFGKYVY